MAAYPPSPVVMVPNLAGRPMPVNVSREQSGQPTPDQQPQIENQPITEEDIKQVQEMFPNVDAEVIKSVFEVNRGNKQGTINSLLQMAEQ